MPDAPMDLLVLGGGAGIVLVAVVLSAVAMLQFGPRARLRKRIATIAGPTRASIRSLPSSARWHRAMASNLMR